MLCRFIDTRKRVSIAGDNEQQSDSPVPFPAICKVASGPKVSKSFISSAQKSVARGVGVVEEMDKGGGVSASQQR